MAHFTLVPSLHESEVCCTSMQLRLFMSSNISMPPYAPSAAICARCHSGAVSPCAEYRPCHGHPGRWKLNLDSTPPVQLLLQLITCSMPHTLQPAADQQHHTVSGNLFPQDAAGRGRDSQVPRQLAGKLLGLRVKARRQELDDQQPVRRVQVVRRRWCAAAVLPLQGVRLRLADVRVCWLRSLGCVAAVLVCCLTQTVVLRPLTVMLRL